MAANSSAASYRFVSEPDDALKCLICLEVAEEPWQHGKCGRLFCEKCLEMHGKKKPCPACRGPPEYFKDNRGQREIKTLRVICGNNGCSAVMELQHIQRHAEVCEHVFISCKYISIGCKEELKRRDMAAHEEDGNAHLKMALEKINLLQEERKNGEQLKLKLTNYGQRKCHNECIQCHPYYITQRGYHMTLRVHTNGYGAARGTHLSVSAPILKGKYDAELKWPFIGKVTFTLLNQLEDRNHFQKQVHVKEKCVGSSGGVTEFISLSQLGHDPVKNTQYLKDDTLYFRMSAEVADHKPWLE